MALLVNGKPWTPNPNIKEERQRKQMERRLQAQRELLQRNEAAALRETYDTFLSTMAETRRFETPINIKAVELKDKSYIILVDKAEKDLTSEDKAFIKRNTFTTITKTEDTPNGAELTLKLAAMAEGGKQE